MVPVANAGLAERMYQVRRQSLRYLCGGKLFEAGHHGHDRRGERLPQA